MKKSIRFLTLALLVATVCAVPFAPALAWKIKGAGSVVRGRFSDSGVSFEAPDAFVLKEIIRGDDEDRIVLEGPKDVNKFIPEIHVTLVRQPLDLETRDAGEDLDFVTYTLEGSKALCLVDEKASVGGTDALHRIIFCNLPDKRMGILYRYLFNLNGVGVIVDYRARTATRSLPDDLAAMRELAESVTVE